MGYGLWHMLCDMCSPPTKIYDIQIQFFCNVHSLHVGSSELSIDVWGKYALVALGRSRWRGAKLHQLLLGHIYGVGRRLHRGKRVGADADLA